ncbi:MAG: PQQ-dependent sugar dehydrogenase [Anaerolineae bacterium]|nr:PQQ-dependent sugar dehydrogenase [Anaerolineae bacterium]
MAKKHQALSVLLAALAAAILLILTRPALIHSQGDQQFLPGPTPEPIIETPCEPDGTIVTQPAINHFRLCPEYLIQESAHDAIASITAITYAPACPADENALPWCNRLFFASPADGAVRWVDAFDPAAGDYPVREFASGLSAPNGLVWHAGALYVAGQQHIYRLQDTDQDGTADVVTILVDNLPPTWNGSLGIGPDNRLYITTGTDCPACTPDDLLQGALLSFALNGSDARVIARGLHTAFGLAWHPISGALVVADDQPYLGPDFSPLEEVNQIITDADYGWPQCFETEQGSTPGPTAPADACAGVTSPAYRLPAHSAPAGMAFYSGAAFPEFADDLLIALQGERHAATTYGYALARLCLDAAGQPEACLDAYGSPVLDSAGTPVESEILVPADIHFGYSLEVINFQQQGFYPEHPIDIAISPEGYIALSIREGRLIQITPVLSHPPGG